ncbi:hypothetical protein N752_02715 [Desulforamulus aquiferis]|nr:hypothetical protein N752_02715 [Desulforamulus aquiferis]
MEEKLDKIAEGDEKWVGVLKEFYHPFKGTLETAEEKIGKVQIADEVTEEICEQCGKNMVIKLGRYGKFLACPGFPDCRNTKPLLEPTGVGCPNVQVKWYCAGVKKVASFTVAVSIQIVNL